MRQKRPSLVWKVVIIFCLPAYNVDTLLLLKKSEWPPTNTRTSLEGNWYCDGNEPFLQDKEKRNRNLSEATLSVFPQFPRFLHSGLLSFTSQATMSVLIVFEWTGCSPKKPTHPIHTIQHGWGGASRPWEGAGTTRAGAEKPLPGSPALLFFHSRCRSEFLTCIIFSLQNFSISCKSQPLMTNSLNFFVWNTLYVLTLER